MRDIIIYVLILALSLGAASFTPATDVQNPKDENLLNKVPDVDVLRDNLAEVEQRCERLEFMIENLPPQRTPSDFVLSRETKGLSK